MKKLLAVGLAALMLSSGIPVMAASEKDPDADFSFEAEFIGHRHLFPQSSQGSDQGTAASGENETAADDTWENEQSAINTDISGYAAEVLRLVNKERTAAGLNELESDPVLTQMADLRAQELLQSYSHTRPDGEKCFTVFDSFETTLKPTGENIATGQDTPEHVVRDWMNSPGHRSNILNESAEYLGVGVTQKSNGVICWEQLFAK